MWGWTLLKLSPDDDSIKIIPQVFPSSFVSKEWRWGKEILSNIVTIHYTLLFLNMTDDHLVRLIIPLLFLCAILLLILICIFFLFLFSLFSPVIQSQTIIKSKWMNEWTPCGSKQNGIKITLDEKRERERISQGRGGKNRREEKKEKEERPEAQ